MGGRRCGADPLVHPTSVQASLSVWSTPGGEAQFSDPLVPGGSALVLAIAEGQACALGQQVRPVGAGNCVTLCDLGVFVDQAAEPVPPQHPDSCALRG